MPQAANSIMSFMNDVREIYYGNVSHSNIFIVPTLYYLPETYSFLRPALSFMSITEVTTPSSIPNILSIPRVRSIRKNRADHRGATGNWLIASVNAINTRPVPEPD